jgi:anti-sigma B factor antagonist
VAFADPQFRLAEDDLDASTHVIAVEGEIHVSTAPQFSTMLNGAIARGKRAVVLDLTDVEFIDSTGLSVLLNGLRRVTRQGGSLALVCTNPTVLRLFEITRLDGTFAIHATRESALAAARAGALDGAGPSQDGRADGSSDGAP